MNCCDCIHNDVCYLQEVTNNIEEYLKEFGCEDYKCKEDVVEVVRCKDCIHYHKDRQICELFTVECDEKSLNYIFNIEDDDYCVKGEKVV